MHESPSVYREKLINNITHMRIWGKEMRKKILIGSMLVLIMLLLMPSIPAIQQKTIEEGIKQDLQEKLNEINIEVLDDIRFPNLYEFVLFIQNYRWEKFRLVWDYATEPDIYPPRRMIHPLLAIYAILVLYPRYDIWRDFWRYISEELNWNWEI